jgi:hypothetical protein
VQLIKGKLLIFRYKAFGTQIKLVIQSATTSSERNARKAMIELQGRGLKMDNSTAMMATRLFLFGEQPIVVLALDEINLPTRRAYDGFGGRALNGSCCA